MSIIPEEEVWEDYFENYNRNPKGIKMYTGIDKAGHLEIRAVRRGKEWWIERESPYANLSGVGMIIDKQVSLRQGGYQTGLRAISPYAMKKMVAMMEGGLRPLEAIGFMEALMREDPLSFDELERRKPPVTMQGPLMRVYSPLHSVIGGQKELEAKLDDELGKLKGDRGSYLV